MRTPSHPPPLRIRDVAVDGPTSLLFSRAGGKREKTCRCVFSRPRMQSSAERRRIEVAFGSFVCMCVFFFNGQQ